MPKLRSLWHRVVRRSRVEREMADELAFHIDARAADLAARHGLSREDALRRARVEFGSVEKYKEEGRASLGLRLVDARTPIRVGRPKAATTATACSVPL